MKACSCKNGLVFFISSQRVWVTMIYVEMEQTRDWWTRATMALGETATYKTFTALRNEKFNFSVNFFLGRLMGVL